MSEPVTALQGAEFGGLVKIRDAGLRGMITLRGDLGSKAVQAAAKRVAGVDFPGPRECAYAGERGLAWMSPDELLIMAPYAEVGRDLQRIATALEGHHHLLADVSDARAVLRIEGSNVREVLAKLSPADLRPESFGPGHFRRTRLAQVPAAFWMPDAETFELICFRSVAAYVFDLLANAADREAGVGYF